MVMVATARPAITTGRSVTARLGFRENAGCQSQHQNKAQQDRINSFHSNLLLRIKGCLVRRHTSSSSGEAGTSQIRRTRIRMCKSVSDGAQAIGSLSKRSD